MSAPAATTQTKSVARSNNSNTKEKKTTKKSQHEKNVAGHIATTGGDSEHHASKQNDSKDSKLQPTAEQIRLANLMNDKAEDSDLQSKVEQIVELTGSSHDKAVIALHDCDNDTAKAVDMILEGDVMDEWQSTGKKKKQTKQNAQEGTEKVNGKDSKQEEAGDEPSGKQFRSEKSSKGGRGRGPPRMQKASGKNTWKSKEQERNDRNDTDKDATNGPPRRNERKGRGGRGSGGRSGRGQQGRGPRTFQNRGLQNNDGFPNSIDTWTNSTADRPATNTDYNTMTVGNWSDIAANEDNWSEEEWDSNIMETKVFTSTKAVPEKDEIAETNVNSAPSSNQPIGFSTLLPKSSLEANHQQAPTMSSILSGNIGRSANTGAALLQQLQSSSSTGQMNQYSSLSQYSKTATESIKSLVGLSSPGPNYNSSNSASTLLSSTDLDNQSRNRSQQQMSANLGNKPPRMKTSRASSKIPEQAVEMPSSDSIGSLDVQFGALQFGTDTSAFSLGVEGFQDTFAQGKNITSNQQSVSSNIAPLTLTDTSDIYRSSSNSAIGDTSKVQNNSSPNVQSTVLGHQQSLGTESLIDSAKNAVSYGLQKDSGKSSDTYSVQQQASANDLTSYKSGSYASYGGASNYSAASTTSNYPYSTSNSGYSQVPTNYSGNFSGSSIHSAGSTQKITGTLDSTQQKHYESMTNPSLSNSGSFQVSSSTVTTNVLRNSLSATGKGMHNVPPGVAPPMLGTQYIMSNAAGLPIYPFPYDVQFPARDHSFPYPSQDGKYTRVSESDVTSVSTSQPASQAHNQTQFVNTFPPGYGFYFTPGVNMMPQSLYGTAPIFPVPPATNAGSANSGFPKVSNAYGSHTYASGYESLASTPGYGSTTHTTKGLSGNAATSDLTNVNVNAMYGKTHAQMTKSYDKPGFHQTGTPPPFNLAAAQASTMGASSYGQAAYMMPQQSMLHTLQDGNPGANTGVGSQRSMGHKASSGSSNGKYYNWS